MFVLPMESFRITNVKLHSVITSVLIKAFQGDHIIESELNLYIYKYKGMTAQLPDVICTVRIADQLCGLFRKL